MQITAGLSALWRNLTRRRQRERDLDEEIRAAFDLIVAEKIQAGWTAEAARRTAAIELGGVEQVKEQVRYAKAGFLVDLVLRDIRYAARSLRRTPGFTAAAVITLALGIGATTAIFAVVDAALVKPLPYPDADRMVVFAQPGAGDQTATGQIFLHLRESAPLFEAIAAQSSANGWNLATRDMADYVEGLPVSDAYFDVHGVSPIRGRGFSRAESQPGGPDAVLISEDLWHRVFQSRGDVVGEVVRLGGVPHTVVGIMPRGFRSVPNADVWTPLRTTLQDNSLNYRVVGKLRRDASLDQLVAEMTSLRADLHRQFPNSNRERIDASVWMSYRDYLGLGYRSTLFILLGAVGFLLFIACVNVAALQLSRSAARQREVVIRAALGAGWANLIRPALAESVILSILGAAGGIAMAAGVTQALPMLLSDDIARSLLSGEKIALDWRVLSAALAVALGSGLLFGIVPAMASSRVGRRTSLNVGGRATMSRGAISLRRGFAIAEVALAMVLLVGAGLLVRTFVNLNRTDLGFDPSGVIVAKMSLQSNTPIPASQLEALFERALGRVRAVPGVVAAAASNNVPVERGLNVALTPPAGSLVRERRPVDFRYVTPDYFTVLRVPLRAGRVFDDRDRADGRPVAIVNEAFARAYFGRADVVGEMSQAAPPREIVGVVADVKARSGSGWTSGMNALGAPVAPTMYVPVGQTPAGLLQSAHRFFPMSWVVRADQADGRITRELQDAVRAVNPLLHFIRFETMDAVIARDLDLPRFIATLVATFAVIAMALAAVGLYGVVAYSVTLRTHEVGIRMALGATAGRVLRAFLREGLALGIAGAALGTAGAIALTRVLDALLFGVTSLDRMTFAMVGAILIAIVALASLIPAVRAARVNPLHALRTE
jgi:putative ABC transport system permease protein